MLLCMRCGNLNDPKENYCLTCGATLPKLAYTMEMAEGLEYVNEGVRKFEHAASAVQSGEWTLEEFEDFMEKIYMKLARIEEEQRNLHIDESIEEAFEEEMNTGFKGMELYNEGMEKMMEYLDYQDPSHLEEGLELIRQGNMLIHKAKVINRQREKKLGMAADAYRNESEITM